MYVDIEKVSLVSDNNISQQFSHNTIIQIINSTQLDTTTC